MARRVCAALPQRPSVPEEAAVADVDVVRVDAMQLWTDTLAAWLQVSEVSSARSRHAVLAFGRVVGCWFMGSFDESALFEGGAGADEGGALTARQLAGAEWNNPSHASG